MFVIVFGILFQIVPAILGSFFTVIGDIMASNNMDAGWVATYNEVDETSQYLVPLIMSLGIVLLVVKVLMIATNRGVE